MHTDTLQVPSDIQIRLIKRERLNEWRVLEENLADLLRYLLLEVEARLHENQVRALPLCCHRWHRGMNAKTPLLVTGGGPYAPLPRSAHRNRISAQCWVVSLFATRVETVHIHMDDAPVAQGLTQVRADPSRSAQEFARLYEDQASPEDYARYLEVFGQLLKELQSRSRNPR